MSPTLHKILLDAFNEAPEGSVTVTGLNDNNIAKHARHHVEAAGLEPWPKPFQALRSSCENDWKQKQVAEATYCVWIGHSPTVSRKHYVSPSEAEFEAVSEFVPAAPNIYTGDGVSGPRQDHGDDKTVLLTP